MNCQSRQFRDSLALAVTFTQPVDAKAELEGFLQVTDTGSSSGKADQDNESAASAGDKPMSVKSGDAAPKGKIVKGSWVVGDNPRMIYFPMQQPQRSYSIALRAGLPGIEKATLVSSSHCEVSTEAMPPSFYFASRGVVLPAGQNGGLPVATVNVPGSMCSSCASSRTACPNCSIPCWAWAAAPRPPTMTASTTTAKTAGAIPTTAA